MKIAILTQPLCANHGGNYGGILQAYALQMVLRQQGHHVVTLNRRNGHPPFKLFVFRLGSSLKCAFRRYILRKRNFVVCSPFARYYNTHAVHTFDNSPLWEFIHNNIVLSQPFHSTKALRKYVWQSGVDCIIVGSDQVWRELYSPCITNYFLDFLGEKRDVKRYAYAASFGVSDGAISKDYLQKCINYLRLFDGVSVREQSGVKYLERVFGYDKAKVVLDPTLLLPADAYRKLMLPEDCTVSGVVSYILKQNREKWAIIVDIAAKIGKPITELTIYPFESDGEPGKFISVSKWLASIANAEFVVTDSFHGCVFSILFRKQFIAIGNKERGMERFLSLLGDFGLLDRLVLSQQEYINKKGALMTPIDYSKVEIIHARLCKESMDFIEGISR